MYTQAEQMVLPAMYGRIASRRRDRQKSLSVADDSIPPICAPKEAHEALKSQNDLLIKMLMEGPKTTRELNEVFIKHTSRVSDCRAAGYKITATRIKGGPYLYELVGIPSEG